MKLAKLYTKSLYFNENKFRKSFVKLFTICKNVFGWYVTNVWNRPTNDITFN